MARAPLRGRTVTFALLALVLAALLVRASGWTPVAPELLPVTTYAARHADDARVAQTLANGTFEAARGHFAWEVFGFREMTGTGIHSFRYHIHRLGDEPVRVWPIAARMLDARGENLGEAPVGAPPAIEEGLLVVRQGFQPRGTGTYELTAIVTLDVLREVPLGYAREDPVEVRLAFVTRSAPEPSRGEAPS